MASRLIGERLRISKLKLIFLPIFSSKEDIYTFQRKKALKVCKGNCGQWKLTAICDYVCNRADLYAIDRMPSSIELHISQPRTFWNQVQSMHRTHYQLDPYRGRPWLVKRPRKYPRIFQILWHNGIWLIQLSFMPYLGDLKIFSPWACQLDNILPTFNNLYRA